MSKNIKKKSNAVLISEHEGIFKCPICSEQMSLFHSKSLICSNHHCFDLSRQGYVNLIAYPLKTKYDKHMFVSRSIICKSGFFEPLVYMTPLSCGITEERIQKVLGMDLIEITIDLTLLVGKKMNHSE